MAGSSTTLRRRAAMPPEAKAEATMAVRRSLAEAIAGGTASSQEVDTTTRRLTESMEPVVQRLAEAPQAPDRHLTEALAQVMRSGEAPVRAAFLARGLQALARLTTALDDEEIAAALGASSDYAVLVQALEYPQALAALQEEDPLAGARLRDLRFREQILHAEGGTLSAEEVARLLGISRQAIDRRRRQGQLLALPVGRHRYAYPAWQFGGEINAADLADVLAEFSVEDPWTQAVFFLGANSYLDGGRPIDELRQGHVEAVRRAAWFYDRQGAP